MRTIFLLGIIAASSYLHAQLPPANPIREAEIRKILTLQEKAWNNGNLDSFMLFYWNSPNLAFITKNGIKRGWQSVYEGYKKSYADQGKMGKLTFDILSVSQTSHDYATVVGSWKVENQSGTQQGFFTLWLRKVKGNWRIVMDHTS